MRARALFPPLSVSQQVAQPFALRLRCNYLQDTVSFQRIAGRTWARRARMRRAVLNMPASSLSVIT